MRQAMSTDEFADLVGASREEVEELRSHGLLDPENDGLLDDVDLMRIRVVRRYVDHLGFEPESLATAIREGRVETPYGGHLFDTAPPLGADDAAAQTGLEADELRQLVAALGLPWPNLRAQESRSSSRCRGRHTMPACLGKRSSE